MDFKLIRHAFAPPGHAHAKGRMVTDPAEIAKILADPHLARTYVRTALTADEKAERDAAAEQPVVEQPEHVEHGDEQE